MRLCARGKRLRISAPRGALTAALRDEIARHKRDLLLFLSARDAAETADDVVGRAPAGAPSPLSFAQERLWFLEQLEPNGSLFNLCRAVRITGALDVSALRASFHEILRRQESLRTVFSSVDGIPVQSAGPADGFDIACIDLRSLTESERENELRRRIVNEDQKPFDLAAGRLLRVCLARLGQDEYALMISTHHLAADAWSMGILARDLWSFYEDYSHGRDPRSAAPRCRYRDYALWQREKFRGASLRSHLDYWKKRLAHSPVLDLPTDRPRPLRPSFGGARVPLEIGPKLTAALNGLSRREDATLFMTLLAAFQVLLFRYSGQEDIVVGAPIANRDRAEFEHLIGLFVNTLALRVDLSGAPSFKELLRRAREVCLDAYDHQEIPFAKIVEELQPARELNRNPLFQTMLVLQNTPSQWAAPRGLIVKPLEIDGAAAPFDLALYLRERGGRLLGYFEYATELFAGATIERMAAHFQNVLERMVEYPHRSIATVEMMSAAERRRILLEWNDTRVEYPDRACIHHLFQAQAERTPEAVALEYCREKWSYRELNRRANQLAGHLRNMGVGPETFVGVLMERSPSMVVGLLAILKAGGAYVPLDPAYPRERLSFMMKDAAIELLLSQREYAGEFADRVARLIAVDDLRFENGVGESNVDGGATADNPAYVIYTSGSSGAPKGVVGRHRGAVNRFSWMWRRYPFIAGERTCAKTSLSFVDSVWEIFGALLQGVPTVIFTDPVAKDAELLAHDLRRRRVTRIVLVPAMLRAMIDQCETTLRQAQRLRYCISSGEALAPELAARFREILPGCRLVNLYGSSEVAGDVACYEASGENIGSTVPIGRPIANTQIYLLDSRFQPVPLGARGEICVGGDNLARGYLRRPELTAEKFIANPFDPTKVSRLYRTGDLARHRSDGNLEFLGRADDQVKIRGWRVELGEIEAALNSHPRVGQSVVVPRIKETPKSMSDNLKFEIQNPKLDKQLVAYIVARGHRPPPENLRAFLTQRLPEPMVPAAFVFLESLPTLPNGKIDPRRLPAPGPSMLGRAQGTVEPRTEIERVVAAIWQTALKMEDVGVEDSFFELGGHSLLAAQVTARLREAFKKEISLRDLFSAPTVAGLAALIEKTIRTDQDRLPPITKALPRRSKPLSASQEPLFLFSQLLGGDFLNMPYAYRLSGALDFPALKKSVNEIVSRHEALRAYFVEHADGPVQRVRRSVKIPIPRIDLSLHSRERREREFERISRHDAARCFDLEQAPLLRVKLIRLRPDEHILLVTLHHIICDQWSMGVFRRELADLYRAFAMGLPSPLVELPIQFSDVVLWQRRALDLGLLDRQIAYWSRQLSGRPAPLTFRNARKPASGARFQSGRHPIELDADLTARIRAFAGQQDCTSFMVLVAALNVLLQRYTGQNDILMGTLAANRGRSGTGGLIGYFVNALVLRTRLAPAMSGLDVVKAVRGVCLEAYVHQDLPFEWLETLLQRNGTRDDAPLYQVMLNYRDFSAPAVEVNGLTIASWNAKNRAADPDIAISRLDLSFHLRQVSTKLTGAVNYKIDLFDQAAIAALVADFERVLRHITERPDQRLSDVVAI